MDKMIHVALNNMKNIRNETVLQAQNIANISVSGYRRDISAQGGSSFLEAMGEFSSRAYVAPFGKITFFKRARSCHGNGCRA
jgi:flagellar basal-body rod protein FlgF